MEKECLYFQWKNDKCFKYMVEDRPRKKFVYGLAYCMEPGVPEPGILQTLFKKFFFFYLKSFFDLRLLKWPSKILEEIN